MVDIYRQELENRPEEPNAACWLQIFRSALWIAAVAAVALSYAWIQLEKLDTSYEIQRLQSENRQLSQKVSALKVEHARLMSPENIERLASQRGFIRIDQGIAVIEGRPYSAAGPVMWAANRSGTPLP